MANNKEIIKGKDQIFDKAIELADNGYTELQATLPYINCDAVVIDKDGNTFQFTNKEQLEQ